MNENQTPAEMSDSVTNAISIESLQADLARMTSERDTYKARLETAYTNASARTAKIESVEEYLRENWDDLDTHASEIAERLGLDMTTTKTFTFDLRVTVEVEANSPAYNWDDFDGREIDFDISASVGWGYRDEISDATVEDTEVTSCEVDY